MLFESLYIILRHLLGMNNRTKSRSYIHGQSTELVLLFLLLLCLTFNLTLFQLLKGILNISWSPFVFYSAILQNYHLLALLNISQLMTHQYHCLLSTQWLYALTKYLLSHLRINSWYGIVKYEDITISIDSSSQNQPSLLTSRQCSSFLTNYCLISITQQLKIRLQAR